MWIKTVWDSSRTKAFAAFATFVIAVATMPGLFAGVADAAPKAAATTCADPSGMVKVGMSYFGNVSGSLQAVGGDASLVPSDQAIVDGYKRAIKALNDAGGLAGCQVSPVIFSLGATAAGDYNQESQQECATFTQDNKVIAVYTAGFETKVIVDCLAKAKTPLFSFGGQYEPSCADMEKYPGYVYLPAGVGNCRYGSFISTYKKAGLFPPNAKVGILVLDDGSGNGSTVANELWIPQLKKLKIPTETAAYPSATNSASFATTSSTLQSAILKFKTDGVNVVLFTPSAGLGPAAWLPQTVSQAYFPNYGFDTGTSLAGATGFGEAAIKTGIGISWVTADLPLNAQEALPTNSAVQDCASWSAPSSAVITGSSGVCDFIHLLQAGFKGATKTDPATLKKGIEGLGTSFVSSLTYGGATRFGKGHYDGASVAQMLTWNPNLKGWQFQSANQKAVPIP